MSWLSIRHAAALLSVLGASAWAQTFESLYNFPTDGADGKAPYGALTLGPDGALYGTTSAGGATDDGTIFKITPDAEEPQITILDNFDELTTGRGSKARLLNIGDGNLYGATEYNGGAQGFAGTVFKYVPGVGLSVVFHVPGSPAESPRRPVALTSGEPNVLHVLGFEPAGIWRIPLDGSAAPTGTFFGYGHFATSLIRGSDGDLYGTGRGGSVDRGRIFRITPGATSPTLLHQCIRTSQPSTGEAPQGAMVEGPDGNFYGAMEDGGKAGTGNGCIYRITPDGEYTIICEFTEQNAMRYPQAGLLLASDGYLYGTALEGGAEGYGGVFRLKPDGSGYKVLHYFNNAGDGRNPIGGLVEAPDGNLYGTTVTGGPNSNGTIYRIKLNRPANRPPVAVDDYAVSGGNEVLINVLANDFDPDGEALTLSIKNAPTHGTASVQGGGVIRYVPGNDFAGSDEFTYQVKDLRGAVGTAVVRILAEEPGPLVKSGLFTGLFFKDPNLTGQGDLPRGQFVLSVGSSGQFTGVLLTQRKRVPFRGSFAEDGTAVAGLKLPGKKPGILFLSFRVDGSVVGVLFGPEVWSGYAVQVPKSAPTAAGRYTVQLAANSDVAAGHGFGVMVIRSDSLVAIVGKLGDGTKLSWGTALVAPQNNAAGIPVFSEPLAGGVIGGALLQENLPGHDFQGVAYWSRPPSKPSKPYSFGFHGNVALSAARFTPPARGESVLDVADGAIILGQRLAVGEFTLDGAKTRTSFPLRALSFDKKTGLFSGKIQEEDGRKTFSFMGVVNQGTRTGIGQSLLGKETVPVTLGPIVP